MATSILLKFLTLKWNISRTICHIEVGDGSLFCIFHALSFELNFIFDRRFPLMETRLKYFSLIKIPAWLSAEFAETIFLLTGKAIGEDPASHATGQPRFNMSHLNLSATFWN